MARPSYGPEAKKRALHLFAAVIDYANDELDCDEAALDALRPQIQTHWQSDQRLVVRTKIRFLEALTQLAQTPLTGDQIKEALRRFEDFLEILDDNRPNKGGSEVWHFTLKLWQRRSQRQANLRQFDQDWEQRRSPKSKQVAGDAPVSAAPPSAEPASAKPSASPWLQLCRDMLEAQQYERLTLNPLTVADGIRFDLHELYLPLDLLERRPQQAEQAAEKRAVDEEESENAISLAEFFNRLQSDAKHRIAIVGEPGAGKTTLLQKIASWLLEQQALPLWVSLADLQGESLEQYLLQDWLKQATRKISVPVELQEAFAAQFQQGNVWLLLDAIDEMAIDAATALTSLARQLRGWIADAHVVLTCRSNVWDGGKNALEEFTTYCNLSLSDESQNRENQVNRFIDRWFQPQPELGQQLQQELSHPKRKRVRDAVKNPLRLALLCRTWSLTQGTLPHTRALLYQQFVETIYAWKQDRFPTTLARRQQLNRALGLVALQALLQPEIRFRLSHSFAQLAFAESLDLMTMALQLGWLNQVGLSPTTGEPVYAFYHPTFQEYFAAQAVADWQFFFDPAHGVLALNPRWREVILLWLGRTDIAASEKEALITALTTFEDGCGNFYSYRAYFLAAAGVAEFPQCSQTQAVVAQLLAWRFGRESRPLIEGARAALLQTDRASAIVGLEQFIQTAEDPFDRWQAAYTLGKILDPGNSIAIAALVRLTETLGSETLRLQVVECLGRIDPNHPIVLQTLEEILQSTQQINIQRRAAYSLGKIKPEPAITVLETLIRTAPTEMLQRQTAENLLRIDPNNPVAVAALNALPQKPARTNQTRSRTAKLPTFDQQIAVLEQRLVNATDTALKRRLACRLVKLQPGHPQAIATLLQLLITPELTIPHKRVAEDLKEVLLDHQLADVVAQLRQHMAVTETAQPNAQWQECHKLLWFCAQRMPYAAFLTAWCSESVQINPSGVALADGNGPV